MKLGATAIVRGIEQALAGDGPRTPDIAGDGSTEAFGEAILGAVLEQC